jgi:DNA-binding CsgD family transcriptional regulator
MVGKINVFEDTPEEKEQYIVDLLQRGYSYKTIMTQCHVSPSTISAVKKNFIGSSDNEKLIQASKTSKESQAFRLFRQGKSLVEVKIELDIASSDAALYYEKYQELSNFHSFNIAYKEVKGFIGPFLQLFNATKNQGMSVQQVSGMVSYGSKLPPLQTMHSNLSSEVRALEREKMNLGCLVQLMADEKEDCMAELQYLQHQCDTKKNELLALDSNINSKNALIKNFDNHEAYIRIKEAAVEQTKFILRENPLLLATTLSATLEAIRKYPDIEGLILDLVISHDYSTSSNQQIWADSHRKQLLQLSEYVHTEIVEKVTRLTVNAM